MASICTDIVATLVDFVILLHSLLYIGLRE